MGESRGQSTAIRSLVGLALALAAFGLSPAGAAADTFFASPTGMGTDCSQISPCSLEHAVETKAQNNDEVVVLPGDYALDSDLQVGNDISLHGISAQQRPKITIDALSGQGVVVSANAAQLRDLQISSTGGGSALGTNSDVERLYVAGEGDATCNVDGLGLVMRDSVCFNGGSGDAISSGAFAGEASMHRLVNVTAVAAGAAVGLRVTGTTGGDNTVTATNVIVSGGTADVRVQTFGAGDTAVVNLDHSNYDTIAASSGGGTEGITIPGSGTNQTALPEVAPGAGNFHQAAGSPTIDKGATNPMDGGTLDLDGEARAQGPSQDIGADEFTFTPPMSPSPPATDGVPFTPPPPIGVATVLVAIAKAKALSLLLRCAAGAGNCFGTVLVSTVKPVRRFNAAASGKRKGKRITLGQGSFSTPAGQTQTVVVPLTKPARKLFRARKKVAASATLTGAGGDTTTRLTVKRKGKRKRK